MERSDARRLQPHYVESSLWKRSTVSAVPQSNGRRGVSKFTHVPAPVRKRDRRIGVGALVLPKYQRIAFEKSLISPQGQPLVESLHADRHRVQYLRCPFARSGVTTDFNGASINFPFADLLARAGEPS